MEISKYGKLILENMKKNYPYRLQELEITGQLEIVLFKREREIIEIRDKLKEKFEKENPKPKTSEIYVISKYYEMINGMVDEQLINEIQKQI